MNSSVAYLLCIFFPLLFTTTLGQYQFFKLAGQWPPTVCLPTQTRIQKPCLAPPKLPVGKFRIHGLWPSNTSQRVEYCSKTKFVSSNIDPTLRNNLNEYWPNLLATGSNESFWESEWIKHGTCSEKNFKQNDYLRLALNIWTRIDIKKTLDQAGIKPSNTITHNINDVVKSIRNKILSINNNVAADPEISCLNYNGKTYIAEVRLCLDSNGNNFISCPIPNLTPACRGNFVILPS